VVASISVSSLLQKSAFASMPMGKVMAPFIRVEQQGIAQSGVTAPQPFSITAALTSFVSAPERTSWQLKTDKSPQGDLTHTLTGTSPEAQLVFEGLPMPQLSKLSTRNLPTDYRQWTLSIGSASGNTAPKLLSGDRLALPERTSTSSGVAGNGHLLANVIAQGLSQTQNRSMQLVPMVTAMTDAVQNKAAKTAYSRITPSASMPYLAQVWQFKSHDGTRLEVAQLNGQLTVTLRDDETRHKLLQKDFSADFMNAITELCQASGHPLNASRAKKGTTHVG